MFLPLLKLENKISMNKNNLPSKIAQSNELTMGRYEFSVIEKRCMYFVISEVRRLYIESNEGQKDLFDNMTLRVPPERLRNLGDEIKDVYNALKRLKNKAIEIENENEWVYTSWILQAKHEKKKDVYIIDVSREILPYLVELATNFTSYDLTVALSLRSVYSQRMYEICNQYKNRANKTFFLDVEKLKYMLKLEELKSYENVYELKRKVLEVAQKELQNLFELGQSDLYFTYRPKETNKRKIVSFFFDIVTKQTEEQIKLDFQNTQAQIARILSISKEFIKKDAKYITRIQNALMLNPNNALDVLEKLNKIVNNYSKEDIPRLIHFVLKEDFDIK